MNKNNQTSYTEAQKAAFIKRLCQKVAKWGFRFGIDIACTDADISKELCLEWLAGNTDYQKRVDDADQQMVERHLTCIRKAANDGDKEAQQWLKERDCT